MVWVLDRRYWIDPKIIMAECYHVFPKWKGK